MARGDAAADAADAAGGPDAAVVRAVPAVAFAARRRRRRRGRYRVDPDPGEVRRARTATGAPA